MKMIVGLLSASALFVAGYTFAAQDQGEDNLAQCKQEAEKAGIQEAEMANFIDNCLNDRAGYERAKPGQSDE